MRPAQPRNPLLCPIGEIIEVVPISEGRPAENHTRGRSGKQNGPSSDVFQRVRRAVCICYVREVHIDERQSVDIGTTESAARGTERDSEV